ncbi:MAG: ABC transporter permease [Chloroflexi bacterium]|nr:ABC transporter permease [Chloroflexota bacterium]MBV9600534.1 ABC transporter permease [Chloroflexota bacterium]
MTELFLGLLKVWTRTTAFVGKDVIEVIRQPGALFSLIFGPFLIMGLFGLGYSGQYRPLTTVLVIPADSNLPRDPAYYQPYLGQSITLTQITDDVNAARQQLQDQKIDLLIIAPDNVEQNFMSGQQSSIDIEYNELDPVRDNYARFVADRQVQQLNQAIVQQAVASGEQYVVQSTGSQPPTPISPEVIAAPTRPDTRNLAPISPNVVAFFAPAVLALVLQHMGVTLTALSLVRERLSGAMDIFRVAPVRALEILVGKYLAYMFFCLAIAALIGVLLVGVLHMPMLGDPANVAIVVVLLSFASLGLGLLISTLVDSERAAVQFSMLVLLASVFFSGFVLPLDQFLAPLRYAAYTLPVTHGIQLLQDYMLRGTTNEGWELYALAAIGVVLFLLTSVTVRRNLRSA